MIETTQPYRLKRLWMPLATLVLGVGGFTALVKTDSLESILQFQIGASLILGTPLLLIFWLMFFSGLRWSHRFAALGCGVLASAGLVYGLTKVFKFDGSIGGSGIPRVRLISTPTGEATLEELKVEAGAEDVDLSADADTNYPQFLGAKRDGVVHGVRLARYWNIQAPKELWRQKIGLGWSAFAVVGDYAITQEQRENKELVVCYELKTGKVRWTHADEVRLTDKQGGDGPRSTPTIVGKRVYTSGGTGVLNCLDGATGKVVWTRDTLGENSLSNIIWGKSCSPLVFDDKVIVTGGKEKHDSLLAYGKDTGKPLWTAGSDDSSYSSPALATLAGTKQILSVNAHSVTGHDPKDGKILWTFSWPEDWAKVSQPVPLSGDRVFLSAGYKVGCVMLHVTRGSDGQWNAEKLWSKRKMQTQFSNVVIARNCAFGLDARNLSCVDLETGEQKWEGARYDFGQVMLVGDLIVVQAEDGYVALVEANPDKFVEISRLPALSDKTWNNPVLSGPYLLVRNDKEAVCYQLAVESER